MSVRGSLGASELFFEDDVERTEVAVFVNDGDVFDDAVIGFETADCHVFNDGLEQTAETFTADDEPVWGFVTRAGVEVVVEALCCGTQGESAKF